MLSVRSFMQRFSDDEACRQYLFKTRWPHGFICPRCGETKYSRIKGRNLFECSICKKQTSVTAGTIMHRTKLPLSYWLFTFYWIASGERCSARKLSAVLKLNYRTALRVLHAVRWAMSNANGNNLFAFWKPARLSLLTKANQMMQSRAELFINRNYRRIAPINRNRYFSEFWFRSNNLNNPEQALDKLISAGSATIWL